jgi:hypothetical protein
LIRCLELEAVPVHDGSTELHGGQSTSSEDSLARCRVTQWQTEDKASHQFPTLADQPAIQTPIRCRLSRDVPRPENEIRAVDGSQRIGTTNAGTLCAARAMLLETSGSEVRESASECERFQGRQQNAE